MTELAGLLAGSVDVVLGMLLVALVIAVTLVMTAQSDRGEG